jgi:hypothetical protein
MKGRKLKSKFNKKATVTLSVSLILLLSGSLFIGTTKAATDNNSDSAATQTFSVVQITDTQFLSASYPTYYNDLADWIITHNSTYNIKMVVHTGDIVDHGDDPAQWVNANASMSRLLKAGIPYSWCAGNHDQASTASNYPANPNGTWIGSQFLAFNATYMRHRHYWVSDLNDGKNTAIQFSCRNCTFLVINLEFHANQTALNWMVNLIKTHPNCSVIVATHSYLNGVGGLGFPYSPGTPEWEENLEATLDGYSNVFLVINGHYIPIDSPEDENAETVWNRHINGREEAYFNRQNAHNDRGADAIRIYTFKMNASSLVIHVHASTYDVYSNISLSDTLDDFSFSFIPKSLTATLSTTPTTLPTSTPQPSASPNVTYNLQTITPAITAPPATATPTPAPTPKPSPTATLTPTINPTPTPTVTSTPNLPTPQPTTTATPTQTPIPTPTASPQEKQTQTPPIQSYIEVTVALAIILVAAAAFWVLKRK